MKVLLGSGGFDSILIYLQNKKKIDKVYYFWYGQQAVHEYAVAKRVYGRKLNCIFSNELTRKGDFWYGRNLNFFITLREMIEGDLEIYFGHNRDDNFPDNSLKFIKKVEHIVRASYPAWEFKIHTPLAKLSKRQIWNKYKKIKKPKILPYFCDKGKRTHCGVCHGCQQVKNSGFYEEYIEMRRALW